MSRQFQRPVIGKRVRGLMYFKQLKPLFARLHRMGTERDRAGNRKLFYDQYVGLILLFFFNPTFRSLRGLQRASTLLSARSRGLARLREERRGIQAKAARRRSRERQDRQPRPAGSAFAGEQLLGSRRRVDCVGLQVSLDDRTFLPLVQMHFGLPTSAVNLPQWRGDPSLHGLDRKHGDGSVDRP